VQGGLERALLDLQYVMGVEFDGLSDGVAMSGSEQQGAEDE